MNRRAWYMVLLDHRERIAAAAACVAVFMIGWQWGRNANAFRMTPGMPSAQPVRFIEQQQIPDGGQNSVFEVRVTDEAGKVIRSEASLTFRMHNGSSNKQGKSSRNRISPLFDSVLADDAGQSPPGSRGRRLFGRKEKIRTLQLRAMPRVV